MVKNYLRTERGERVDQPDFDRGVNTSQREGLDQLVDDFLIGEHASNPHTMILRGFSAAAVGTVITVTRGVALMGYRLNGETRFSTVLSGGPATKSIDISTYPDGTYQLYARYEFVDGNFLNRIFWNPLATTPTEEVRNVGTVLAEDWALAVEGASPGEEWRQLYQVAKAGAVLTLSDRRLFFFEGDGTASFAIPDAQWGSANDRLGTRGTDPTTLGGFYRFVKMVLRQLQDIIGVGYWTAVDGTLIQSLSAMTSGKLARNGTQTMQGNLLPDGDATRNLGSGIARWNDLFIDTITGTSSLFAGVTAISNLIGTDRIVANDNEDGFRFFGGVRTFYSWLDASLGTWDTNDAGVTEAHFTGGDPSSVANANRIDIGITGALADDVEVYFPIKLPNGCVLSQVDLYLTNNSASATRVQVRRQTLSNATRTDMRSGGEFSVGSQAGGNIGEPPVVISVDQNNTIDNSLYRYYLVVRCLGTFQNQIYGAHLHYTSDRLRMQG